MWEHEGGVDDENGYKKGTGLIFRKIVFFTMTII